MGKRMQVLLVILAIVFMVLCMDRLGPSIWKYGLLFSGGLYGFVMGARNE